jgi:hypothetical protein
VSRDLMNKIAMVCAVATDCPRCINFHKTDLIDRLQLSADEVEKLHDFENSDLPEAEKAVYRVARKLTLNEADDRRRVQGAARRGLRRRAITEIVSVALLEGGFARHARCSRASRTDQLAGAAHALGRVPQGRQQLAPHRFPDGDPKLANQARPPRGETGWCRSTRGHIRSRSTRRTAIIVVDMQNAYAKKGGMLDMGTGIDESRVGPVIEANKRLLPAARGGRQGDLPAVRLQVPDLSDAGGPQSPNIRKQMAFKLIKERPSTATSSSSRAPGASDHRRSRPSRATWW